MMMRILKQGMVGVDVRSWQIFLIGRGLDGLDEETGVFDEPTVKATKGFQWLYSIRTDGVVGNQTYAKAMDQGFQLIPDLENTEETGPNWPPVPDFRPLLGTAAREALFGHFPYKASPSHSCPEGIQILGDWAQQNITTIEIPQLTRVPGAPTGNRVQFHVKGARQLLDLFQAWEDNGLLPLVLSWAGSWAPRFIRGSKSTLSNHAFGTAFDINAAWNALGVLPALTDQTGSVRPLVKLANEHGFYWGGHFGVNGGRPDGMHFEVAQIL